MFLFALLVPVSIGFRHCSSSHRGFWSPLRSSSEVADEISGLSWTPEFKNGVFLAQYWQKKPLLIRDAFNAEDLIPIDKTDILALAKEEDVESRAVSYHGRQQHQEKEYGPFGDDYFTSFDKSGSPWTVLVQEVDRHVPAMADLWQREFDFIPTWRRDDVMVSYAKTNAGIGAHVDDYDVFLIQGRGTRRWSIEKKVVTPEQEQMRLVSGADTKLLRDFTEGQSWILNPGDILYLPPRFPHMGVSLDDSCITVSMVSLSDNVFICEQQV